MSEMGEIRRTGARLQGERRREGEGRIERREGRDGEREEERDGLREREKERD